MEANAKLLVVALSNHLRERVEAESQECIDDSSLTLVNDRMSAEDPKWTLHALREHFIEEAKECV